MKFFCTTVLILFSVIAAGQELPPITQQQLENLADATENELDDDQQLQQLDFLKEHPLDINAVTDRELQSLGFISALQIEKFLQYRKALGKFIDIHELQSIPCWDLVTTRKTLPFFTVGSLFTVKEKFLTRFKGDQAILFRISRSIEAAEEYDTSRSNHYLGDRNHLFLRYRYQYKNLLYFGLNADKDPGEQFFRGAQSNGFDFYSIHFFARELGVIKALAVGDFTVNLGQGLIEWQSMGFGKSSDALGIKRQGPVLMPYRSAGEFNFNRGLGITIGKKNFESTVFASRKKISGNINDSVEVFSSMQTSGYHRSASEIEDRNKINLSSFGGSMEYRAGAFKIAFNSVVHHFDIPLAKSDLPYKLFSLSGSESINAGIDYSYTFHNLHLFGELAGDRNLNPAFLGGVILSPDPAIDLSFLYRNISAKYTSLFGNAFTESTTPSDENGLYLGASIRPGASWQLNAYADFFKFPWLRYRINAPVSGYDYLVQLAYQVNKKSSIYLRYRNKNKPINENQPVMQSPVDQVRQSIRFHFSSELARGVAFHGRWEMLEVNTGGGKSEEGFLGFIEASCSRSRFQTDLRLQYFETPGYDSRIYAYETDLPTAVSIPAFYDKGLHYYINLEFRIDKRLKLWMRWNQSIFLQNAAFVRETSESQSGKNSEIKLQVEWAF
jgi:hypothetical protein